MFTKKIPITEALEHHINSSSDSNGEDSSFEDPDGEFYSPPSIEDIKFKHMRYSNYRQKRVLRQKELDDDKSSSMWKSLYYTFFNNQKDNTITLSELELRCKFLFNMDDLQAKQNPNSVSNNKNKGITPLTNVEKFIKHFSEHKEDNLLIKIFRKKKNQQDQVTFQLGASRITIQCAFSQRGYDKLGTPRQMNLQKYKRVSLHEILPL